MENQYVDKEGILNEKGQEELMKTYVNIFKKFRPAFEDGSAFQVNTIIRMAEREVFGK